MSTKFKINLKAVHEKTTLTAYAVAKATGLSQATVRRYAYEDDVVLDYVPTTVVALANFYGVDWRSPDIVEVIEDGEEGESAPEIKTPLPVPA